jgi:hypothetical protein
LIFLEDEYSMASESAIKLAAALRKEKTHRSRSRVGFIPQGNTDLLAASL